MNKFKINKFGFTLIELLVVVGIIGILVAIIITSLGDAKKKSNDSSIKSTLSSTRSQAELFYHNNSLSYDGVCATSANSISELVTAAAKVAGLGDTNNYSINAIGSTSQATCNHSASAWAVEVPLYTAGEMWCVDSTGKSLKETGSSLSSASDYTCI